MQTIVANAINHSWDSRACANRLVTSVQPQHGNYTDGTSKDLKPSDIPIGAMAYAYYTNYSEKVNGKRSDVHEAFMLRVKTIDGVEHR